MSRVAGIPRRMGARVDRARGVRRRVGCSPPRVAVCGEGRVCCAGGRIAESRNGNGVRSRAQVSEKCDREDEQRRDGERKAERDESQSGDRRAVPPGLVGYRTIELTGRQFSKVGYVCQRRPSNIFRNVGFVHNSLLYRHSRRLEVPDRHFRSDAGGYWEVANLPDLYGSLLNMNADVIPSSADEGLGADDEVGLGAESILARDQDRRLLEQDLAAKVGLIGASERKPSADQGCSP